MKVLIKCETGKHVNYCLEAEYDGNTLSSFQSPSGKDVECTSFAFNYCPQTQFLTADLDLQTNQLSNVKAFQKRTEEQRRLNMLAIKNEINNTLWKIK